ncbi:MAG: AAA family ATPase, partial [Alphaproteobacteria bacterium]
MSRKGGAGKTTVAVNLALEGLASGRRVVLADIDPQRSSLEALRGREDVGSFLVTTTAAKLFTLSNECERSGCDLLVIDTAPAPEPDVIAAMNIADLCLAVARPTFLDLASVAQSMDLMRRLRKPGMTVLNQCPPTRNGIEAPAVLKAFEALRYAGLPVAPVALRSRAAYQTALPRGRSMAEYGLDDKAASELEHLFAYVLAQLDEETRAAPP